ncbi:MAG: DNA topoisomerase IB [Rudaea sp.]
MTSAELPLAADRKTLKRAGLIHVSDAGSGLVRQRRGKSFVYLTPSGARVRDGAVIDRIRSLAIPPAYTDVWICRLANGHLQATGRDARGRKQYRYHARWREVRDEAKFDRLAAFAAQLPKLRRQVNIDLKLDGLPRRKVIAAVVRLLETSFIRVGNEEYSRHNGSFGLTTLRNRHVRVRGARMLFEFRGKSRVTHALLLEDARLAGIVRRCQELPGQKLFRFRNTDGRVEDIDSEDVNAYLREVVGDDFSAKDFRTWAGTLLAARALDRSAARDDGGSKTRMLEAVAEVARRLGNTPAVCRKCYIHPALFDAYEADALRLPPAARRPTIGLDRQERAVLGLLRRAKRS